MSGHLLENCLQTQMLPCSHFTDFLSLKCRKQTRGCQCSQSHKHQRQEGAAVTQCHKHHIKNTKWNELLFMEVWSPCHWGYSDLVIHEAGCTGPPHPAPELPAAGRLRTEDGRFRDNAGGWGVVERSCFSYGGSGFNVTSGY